MLSARPFMTWAQSGVSFGEWWANVIGESRFWFWVLLQIVKGHGDQCMAIGFERIRLG